MTTYTVAKGARVFVDGREIGDIKEFGVAATGFDFGSCNIVPLDEIAQRKRPHWVSFRDLLNTAAWPL